MRMGSERIRLAAWFAVIVAVGVVGYLIGHGRRSATVTNTGPGLAISSDGDGTAYFLGAHQPLSEATAGFAYRLPQRVQWTDASGTIHEGSRPSCLPLDRAVRVKDMEAVQFTIPPGVSTGIVVWVRC
jgi:hypothetical protein